MKAYKDHNARYYIKIEGLTITRKPRIAIIRALPASAEELPEDDAAWVLMGFIDTAQHQGGDSVAIHHLKEIFMAKSKGFLIINMAALAIVHMYAFEKEALAAVAKEDGPFFGHTIIGNETEFAQLSVEEKCALARPLLNEKETAEVPDGQGLADIAWKVVQRFKNPKPVKGTTEKPGAKEKEVKAPVIRPAGVKTLIFEHFTQNKDTAHLTVEEIMATVKGSKASVTTAISDLRSPKYCGKNGIMNLVRLDGKYCLAGSAVAEKAAAAEAAAKEAAEAAKKEAAAKKAAAKEAEAAEAAPEAAEATA